MTSDLLLKAATFGFVLATLALVFWLFACWYVFSGAEFDCADLGGDLRGCVSEVHWKVAIQAAIPVAAWGLFGWLLAWAWTKF